VKAAITERALAVIDGIVHKFDPIEAELATLEQRYKDVVYDVTSPTGMREAKAARQEIRQPRYAAQNIIDEAKAPLNAMKAAISARGTAIVSRIAAIEAPIHQQITEEEERKAAEKAEQERLIAERQAEIAGEIYAITSLPMTMAGASWAELCDAYDKLEAREITLPVFGTRAGEAEQEKLRALEAIEKMRSHAKAIEDERAELARQREEAAELSKRMQAEERQRMAAQRKANEEAAAALKAQADELRRQQEDFAAQVKAKADADFAEAQAKRRAETAERNRIEEAERAERRRVEDEERAKRQAEALAAEQEAEQRKQAAIEEGKREHALMSARAQWAPIAYKALLEIRDSATGGNGFFFTIADGAIAQMNYREQK
jgi:hypothetical protein